MTEVPAGVPADKIEQTVIGVIVDHLGIESSAQVTKEARFVEDLNADSLDTAEIIMKIEEEFGIQIPQDEQMPRTVGEAVEYVRQRIQAKQA
jgi:acyl carrier protein